jgi:hypothetical protein
MKCAFCADARAAIQTGRFPPDSTALRRNGISALRHPPIFQSKAENTRNSRLKVGRNRMKIRIKRASALPTTVATPCGFLAGLLHQGAGIRSAVHIYSIKGGVES